MTTQDVKAEAPRKFGLEVIGDIPWGTHFSQFYMTKDDLIEILVPYFAEGLRNNEFCMWVTSPPLDASEAREALERAVPNLNDYVKRGQIAIVPYWEWYLKGGEFNADRVLQGWVEKETAALNRGFEGLRLTGNTFWVERDLWKSFAEYEAAVNAVIPLHRVIALCTYSLEKCIGTDVVDVLKNHVGILIRKGEIWHFVEDVTKRRKAEETLAESEERYRSLFDNMNSAFAYQKIVLDDDGKPIDYIFLDANEDFVKLTGLKKEEILGKKVTEVLPGIEKDPADWIGIYGKVAVTGEPVRFENYSQNLKKWYSVSAYCPKKGYFAVAFDDITERKRFAEQVESLARFPSENPEPVLRISKNGIIIYSNAPGSRILNEWKCEVGQLAPNHWVQLVNDSLSSGSRIETEENIGEETFAFILTPVAEYVNVYGRGITKRKRAEDSLRESQKDLNRAQAVANTGSWRLDLRRNELLWSDETYRMFGIQAGTPLTYEVFLSKVHPEDREYVDKKWQAALRGERYDIEHRILVNGEVKWVREKAELDFNEERVLLSGFGTVQDITERKEMEQELRSTLEASQHRQAEISALLGAAKAVLQNREFQLAAHSIFDSCKELLGATAGYVALLSEDKKENEIVLLDSGGLPCKVDPSLPMPIRGLRAEAYRTGKVVYCNDFPRSEWTNLMPEGHVILNNVLFAPLTIDTKTVGIIGLANKPVGFTERDAQMALAFGEISSIALVNSRMLEKLAENEKLLKAHSEQLENLVEERTKQLKDAERLSAIGETAGMVGHDIRNPLQAIIGELYLAKDSLHSLPESSAKQDLTESMRVVEEQAVYINKIVTDLQDYAKPLSPCMEEINLEKIIESVLSIIEIPETIEVSYEIKGDFPKLMTDPSFVKRILTNLISNAAQAMPNGGKLTINLFSKDKQAFLSVEDTGEGIVEEAKSKLFKPLFTTKAKGQGFGLAVVKKLTEALGGTITFESEMGKGTKFIIELPIEPKTNGKTQKE